MSKHQNYKLLGRRPTRWMVRGYEVEGFFIAPIRGPAKSWPFYAPGYQRWMFVVVQQDERAS